jgi:hypothetical protein
MIFLLQEEAVLALLVFLQPLATRKQTIFSEQAQVVAEVHI